MKNISLMPISSTVDDIVDDAHGHVILARQRRLRHSSGRVSVSDFGGLCVSQRRARMLFTGQMRGLPSSLCPHVSGVIFTRSEEQMIGPDARRGIAAVQHPLPSGDRAIVKFPGNAVSAPRLPINAELSVAGAVSRPVPAPARLRLLDMQPELLFERAFPFQGLPVAWSAAVLHLAGSDQTVPDGHLSLARQATDRRGSTPNAACRLLGHRPSPVGGVTPSAVTAARGLCASNYTWMRCNVA